MHLPLVLASLPLSRTSAALAGTLIASIWQAVLLTLAVAFTLRLLPGLSAAAKSAVWTVVLLLIVALPALPLTLPHAHAAATGLIHVEETFSFALVALWLAASLFRLVQLTASAFRLHGILRRAQPIGPTPAVSDILRSSARPVTLCSSNDIDRPSVAGFFRPRILFPPELLAGLTEPELAQIVLHETQHLRRHDDWVNLLQQVSLVLFPLNPALLWLNRRLSLERELACDDSVLEATRARKAYAACLARVAENSLVRRSAALVLGILGPLTDRWARKPELARRVERILSAPARMSRTQIRFATGTVLAGILTGAAVLAHAPALVSFTPAIRAEAQADSAAPLALPVSVDARLPLPRPTLVKAILPSPPAIAPAAIAPNRRLRNLRSLRIAQRRRAFARQRQPMVVLTTWHQPAAGDPLRPAQNSAPSMLHTLEAQVSGNQAPISPSATAEMLVSEAPAAQAARPAQQDSAPVVRLTAVVIENSQTWYTAVAIRGGWIVFQL